MWNYGKDIIRHFFKERSGRTAVYPLLASQVQADSDRSDIRVFEVGLSPEQYGDYQQSTGVAAQETESKRLITIAKANNFFINKEQWQSFGDRKRLPSGESIVYINHAETFITKIRNPFAKCAIKELHAPDVIYEHLIHNILFPATRYDFVGISEDAGDVRIVLRQKYFSDRYLPTTQKDIDKYLLQGLGLRMENRYYYANGYIAITDVSATGDNVLTDGQELYFIDPIIKFKKPAPEVLLYYYHLLK